MQFQMSETQIDQLANWRRQHQVLCQLHLPGHGGAIGGSLTYVFTPTNLGTVLKVQCACGKEIDLTDYDAW